MELLLAQAVDNFRKLRETCRESEAFFPAVALRHLYYRAHGKDVLACDRVKILGLRNIDTAGGRLRVGLSFVGFTDPRDTSLVRVRGKFQVRGNFSLGRGCRIDIGPQGVMRVGAGYANPDTKFVVMHSLTVGNGCAISWGCTFLDDDFHLLKYPGRKPSGDPAISLGDRVWIGCNVTVLKGSHLPTGSVVAAGAVVNSRFVEENTLIGGNPARVLRYGVTWE